MYRHQKRIPVIAAIVVFCALFMISCGNKPEETLTPLTPTPTEMGLPTVTTMPDGFATPTPTLIPTSTSTPTPSPTVTPTPSHDGEAKSKLTGLWIPEDYADRRPYAVMINNIRVASPQSGLSEADILYEALVEYGITRFMAVFDASDVKSEIAFRIGSIRSARHYYISFANEFDAVFVHFGKTTYADSQFNKQHTDHIDGMFGGINGEAFARDKSIEAPHNVFMDLSVLEESLKKKKMRTELDDSLTNFFMFHEEDTEPVNGIPCAKVTLNFSSGTSPWFIYDEETRNYVRYQYGKEHIDPNNGTVLKFKNIIVQFVKEWDIDKNGYQTMKLDDTSGTGYYISDGTAVPITWTKNEAKNERTFLDIEGNELMINAGKTYVAIFPNNKISSVIISETQVGE